MAEWRSFLAELDWQKLTSTALFAGLVAILATVAIERFGGKLGGVLATLPTTIIPASLGFWYLSESDGDFIVAMWSVPIGMLLDAAFLHSWRWIPPRVTLKHPMLRLVAVVSGTLGFWFMLAFTVVTALQDVIEYIYWFGGSALLFQVDMVSTRVQAGNVQPQPLNGCRGLRCFSGVLWPVQQSPLLPGLLQLATPFLRGWHRCSRLFS